MNERENVSISESVGKIISEIPTYARRLRETIDSFGKTWKQSWLLIGGMVVVSGIIVAIHPEPQWMFQKMVAGWGFGLLIATGGSFLEALMTHSESKKQITMEKARIERLNAEDIERNEIKPGFTN